MKRVPRTGPDDLKRSVTFGLTLTPDEAARMDALMGGAPRTAWLRAVVARVLPDVLDPRVPTVPVSLPESINP